MTETNQTPQQQNSGSGSGSGCGTWLFFIVIILAGVLVLSGNAEAFLDDPLSFIDDTFGTSFTGEKTTADKAGLPKGSHLIEFYGGVDPDNATDDEISAGMDKGREELAKAFDNMETGFYIDSSVMLRSSQDLPARVFWVDSWTLQGVRTEDGKRYYRVEVDYLCTEKERDRMQKEVDSAAKSILSKVPSNADNWEKALIIHDELVKRVTYDRSMSREHRYDIYGALVEGQAVCAGYAKSFEYLMDELGVYARYDTSTFFVDDGDSGHAWNHIVGDGGVCYVDVTWDDPDSYDSYGNPYVQHEHFCLTQLEISQIDSHEMGTITDKAAYSHDNYHRRMGYFMDGYSHNELVRIFGEQVENGDNLLSVKFADKASYEQAMTTLCGSGWRDWSQVDTTELWSVLGEVMPWYDDSISIGHNDELYLLQIYLYPA